MERYEVREQVREGVTSCVLIDRGTKTEAEVLTGIGMNLIRFEAHGHPLVLPSPSVEKLKTEPFAPFQYGTPVLFPPNRVQNGTFAYQGRTYRLPLNEPTNHLHGEICSRSWKVIRYSATEEQGASITAEFRYAEHADIMSYFPHPLVFSLTYSLQDGCLSLSGTIVNEGDQEAPFAFGLHPYFLVPDTNQEKTQIVLPALEEWPVTTEAFVTGLPEQTELSEELNGGVPLDRFPAGSCWLFTLEGGTKTCSIRHPHAGLLLHYQVDESFPYLVLFRPDWASAISFEPYTYVTDAFNLPWDYAKTGARGLAAKEEFVFRTKLWAEEIQSEKGE